MTGAEFSGNSPNYGVVFVKKTNPGELEVSFKRCKWLDNKAKGHQHLVESYRQDDDAAGPGQQPMTLDFGGSTFSGAIERAADWQPGETDRVDYALHTRLLAPVS